MKRDTLLEIAVGLSAAAAVAALFAWSGRAHSTEVYRCGNTYQDAHCAGGARLEIDPNTNLIQRETRVPTVCGLHVAWNLRVVRRAENARKAART